MSELLQKILDLANNLSPEERKRLRYELSKPYKKQDRPPEGDWLLEGIINELNTRGLWTRGLTPDVPTVYTESAEAIKADLLERMGETLSYRDKLALGQMVAKCLIYYLGPNAPISLKFLCNSILHTHAAINRSFPGYLRGGLLRQLIK